MSLAILRACAPTLLENAEYMFGPREAGWPAVDVELDSGGPVLDSTSSPGRLVAYLHPSVSNDLNNGLYQLSHEIFHALAPVPGRAMMIEEAGAVWFSLYGLKYPHALYLKDAEDYLQTNPLASNYLTAWKLHGELEAMRPAAIRFLRSHDPRLDNLNEQRIRSLIPGVSSDLARRLCERRQMR